MAAQREIALTGALDGTSTLPLYYQIKEILREAIDRSGNHPDTKLPREIDIAQFYGVSRITARQAVLELVKDGICYRVKGKGTFTARGKIDQDFVRRILSFDREMKNKGLTPSTVVLTLEKSSASADTAYHLGLEEGADIIRLDRLRSADGEPLVIVETCLPWEYTSFLLKEDMGKKSLYALLGRKKKTAVHRIVRTIEAETAGQFESALLQVPPGHPIQRFSSVSYTKEGIPIEYSRAGYRGDRSRFNLEIMTGDAYENV